MNKEVTVIIPIFNEASNIDKLIQSMQIQTFQDFELFFVDDGSSDNSKDIILKYSHIQENIRYIYQLNKGVGSARNRGILESKGKYVCFLDADDYYDVEFLEKMYNEIIKKDSDLCFCSHYIDTPKQNIKVKSKFKSSNYLLDYILGKIKAHTDSWMLKKSFLLDNSILFSEEMNWGEDFYFFCQVMQKSKNVSFVKENLSHYTHDFSDNRLSKNEINKIEADIKVIHEVISVLNVEEGTKIYSALIDYRLPTMLLNRMIDLTKHPIESSELFFLKEYKRDYSRLSFQFGVSSIKQIIRYIQFHINFILKRMRLR